MKIEVLFQIQQKLDDKIAREHGLTGQDLTIPKVLALLVELGELANETRCFKYWSKKAPSEESVILEEYVDCLHFILSLGLDKGFTDVNLAFEANGLDLTAQFLGLYSQVEDFRQSQSREAYGLLWKQFLALGHTLGFSAEKLESAYLHKNQVNHQRQEQGY